MELDTEARRILELAGGARSPNEGDKARVERRIALALGAGAAASLGVGVAKASEHALASKAVGSALALKYAVVGSALLAIGVTAYVGLLPAAQAPAAQVRAPVAARVAAAPVAQAPVQPAPQPSALPAATTPAMPAGAVAAPERARPKARPRHAAADPLAREVELLHRAQAAWRARDAKGALALLREHRARHPRSSLRLERDALQALALCELGKRDEGARIGRRVLDSAPSSPLRASIEQSCALK